jgi:uroporphyrinogen decarboxylase
VTPRQRVEAALAGEPVDRVPICFWHHFRPEGSGERLAEQTLGFFRDRFALDIVKVMPDLPYPGPPSERALDVGGLPRLEVGDTPAFQQQLVCVRVLRAALGPDAPLVVTLFSPLATVRHFVRDQLVEVARSNPQRFEEGLATVAVNLRELMRALVQAGADGVFYSCMGATSADFTAAEYERFGVPHDLAALEGARDGWLNIVHVHADPSQGTERIYFELFDRYPAQVLSWSDRLTGPTLRQACGMTDRCLMGGLFERGPLTRGGEREIAREIESAIDQTGGRRLILANGCSVPDDTPEEWLATARRLVEDRAQGA